MPHSVLPPPHVVDFRRLLGGEALLLKLLVESPLLLLGPPAQARHPLRAAATAPVKTRATPATSTDASRLDVSPLPGRRTRNPARVRVRPRVRGLIYSLTVKTERREWGTRVLTSRNLRLDPRLNMGRLPETPGRQAPRRRPAPGTPRAPRCRRRRSRRACRRSASAA